MNKSLIDLRNIACGLLLGVGVTLAMAQAPAAPQPSPRYQITALRGAGDSLELIILDHATNRLYQERPGFIQNATTVEQLLKH